jgi:Zn-dependent oligopeptidase
LYNYVEPETKKTYETVLEPLEKPSASFDYAWSVVKTLNVVKNDFIPSEGYLKIHERAREARSKKFMSLPIYYACKVM